MHPLFDHQLKFTYIIIALTAILVKELAINKFYKSHAEEFHLVAFTHTRETAMLPEDFHVGLGYTGTLA